MVDGPFRSVSGRAAMHGLFCGFFGDEGFWRIGFAEGMKRVVPIVRVQKIPDRTFDRTGINLICMRLATIITEQ